MISCASLRNVNHLKHRRILLLQRSYDQPLEVELPFDLILFSYSLTMMNPGWSQAIDSAYNNLPPGGRIAVVDFHDSPMSLFKRWMQVNHVRLDGHLLPYLMTRFRSQTEVARRVYGGLWRYFIFVGQKR